jgi:tryptophan synthase alpha chain
MPSRSLTTLSDPLASYFAQWRADRRTALIPYITAGYPRPADTAHLLEVLATSGADIIELGVPFSDPVADGPTIQRSSQAALDHGITLAWTLNALAVFRRSQQTPVVVFTYLNPLLAFGVERFIEQATAAGAQAVLITDLPLDADPALERTLEASPLSLVRLIAPTTAPERARQLAQRTQGFLYYVARLGVTGARDSLREDLIRELTALRSVSKTPVAVGFGISTPQQAQTVAAAADGIVIGSAVIDAIDRGGIPEAGSFLRSIRQGLDRG